MVRVPCLWNESASVDQVDKDPKKAKARIFRSSISKRLQSLVQSRLKDGEVIGVVDEDAAEEARRQDTVEPLYPWVLLVRGILIEQLVAGFRVLRQ